MPTTRFRCAGLVAWALALMPLSCGSDEPQQGVDKLDVHVNSEIGFTLDGEGTDETTTEAVAEAVTEAGAEPLDDVPDLPDLAEAADTLEVDACPGSVSVTDVFHQLAGNKADVLFVVDGSGSMTEHVDALADDLDALVLAFLEHGTDFHLGAVGISAPDDYCDAAGDLMGQPRIMTADSWQGLHEVLLASMDDACANSGIEAGLQVATLALSPDKIAQTTTLCGGGGSDGCGPGMECVDGLCGGPNLGFLRPDAALHVLVISDEEDQSPESTEAYVAGFLSIKGAANPDLFRFHAIVGQPGAYECPDGSMSDPGLRYLEVAQATGGKVRDVCTDDFAGVLGDIGDVGVSLQTAWTLSQPAQPGSLSLAVNGQPCGGGWQYVPATNQVQIDPQGPCMPWPGQALNVTYSTPCAD